MIPSLAAVRSLASKDAWVTLTRVGVKLPAGRGGYVLEVEGPIVDVLDAMESDGEIESVEFISGLAHSPTDGWTYAFRLDASGLRVASNAPTELVATVVVPALANAVNAA